MVPMSPTSHILPQGFCRVTAAAVIVTALGCADAPTAQRPFVGAASSARTVPIDAFGIASVFPTGGAPCTAPEYRQFDFWLGNWDAHRTDNNALSGTDVISSRLG